MSETVGERFRSNATGIVSTLVTAIWLAALFTGQEWWLAALIIGYVAVVPLTGYLFGDEETEEADAVATTAGDEGDRDALETLRERYARGELTDEQFERKLERLIGTETVEDVEERVGTHEERVDGRDESRRERAREREWE